MTTMMKMSPLRFGMTMAVILRELNDTQHYLPKRREQRTTLSSRESGTHNTVILRERSEPKDLLSSSQSHLEDIPFMPEVSLREYGADFLNER